MNQKNIWWWIGGSVIAVIALVMAGLFISQTVPMPDKNPVNATVTTTKQTIQKDDGMSKIDIEYPMISGVSQAINDTIQEVLNTRIEEFKKIVAENEQARIDTNKNLPVSEQRPVRPDPSDYWYSLYIRYNTGIITNQTISVVFFVDEYSGGAHGNKSFIPFNYDIVQDRTITLADVFIHDARYLNRISEYVYRDIVTQITALDPSQEPLMDWIQRGTDPQIDNFLNFTLGENTITFYIPPYQVAAYALGDFQVTMPLQ
ncbi:MAG: DUF3298 and DUF4163 domain-containing protein [Candidatus Paceibacterota bacterium]